MPSSVTRLAKGLTIRTARFIVGGTMPRIDHVAVETVDPDETASFYERVFGARIVKTEGHPVMAYLGNTGLAFHEPSGAGRPHRRARLGRGARRDQAAPRRRGGRVRRARPRDRRRPLLSRSRRAAVGGDHLRR